MTERFVKISVMQDAKNRFIMNQSIETFLVNMLKDYLRADYSLYEGAPDKQEFAANSLSLAIAALIVACRSDEAIWEESEKTLFGSGRRLSRLGAYLLSVVTNYDKMSVYEINHIIELAQQKVG